MSDSTLWSVFEGLLGLATGEKANKSVNDNTVDASIKLITKIGPSIDEKLKKQDWQSRNETHVKNIFIQFEYLMNSDDSNKEKLSVSQRLKLLIKNMFENKNSGWSKSKNLNSELKNKKEVEDEVMR